MDGQGELGKEYRLEILGLVIAELAVGCGAIGEVVAARDKALWRDAPGLQ